MAKKSPKGKYITLNNVRASYDEKNDTVHLTAKDSDFPSGSNFHLTLSKGRESDELLRNVLKHHGLIPESKIDSLPRKVEYKDRTMTNYLWDRIPLGVTDDGNELFWDFTSSPSCIIYGHTGYGKSVVQRAIIKHCSMRPSVFDVYGIDLKQAEFKHYHKYNVFKDVAHTVEDALRIITKIQDEMQSRYKKMAELKVNHFSHTRMKAIVLLIDEIATLEGDFASDTEELKAYKTIIKSKIASLLSLGRAAGVYLSVTSQRQFTNGDNSNLPSMDYSMRIVMGRISQESSQIVLGDSKIGSTIPNIRGRGYVQLPIGGLMFQSYYLDEEELKNNHAVREPQPYDVGEAYMNH